MEFHQKLQELRKRKGLTQEELAQALYVSRAAVSKWESGRGYPSIDSLKALAKFFGVSVDGLLSGQEVLTVAEEDNRQKVDRFRDLVFGALDLSALAFLFLPLFGQDSEGAVSAVSLLSLSGIRAYLKTVYFGCVFLSAGMGILTLAPLTWHRGKHSLSLLLTAVSVLVFLAGRQPYSGALVLISLIVKVLILTKQP